MKPTHVFVFFILIFLISISLWQYRNIRFDKGVMALKSDDYQTAVDELKPLALLGDSESQYLLGQMYAFGWGVPKNDSKAIEWLRRSATWGESESERIATAAFYIGRDYAEGSGAIKNEEDAVKWYQISAERGSVEAAKELGKAFANGTLNLPRDPRKSEYWLQKAESISVK